MAGEHKINYLNLGDSEIEVSTIGYGTYHLREKLGSVEAAESLGRACAAGVGLIDTSDNYGSEDIIGFALREGLLRRSDFAIATKTGLATSIKEHLAWEAQGRRVDTSPERIRRQLGRSLSLMETEWIDLYQLHAHDPSVPFEVIADTMAEVVEEGEVRAYGVSNYSAGALEGLLVACDQRGLHRPTTLQAFYNIIDGRSQPVIELARSAGMTVLAHSPLHKGLLSEAVVGVLNGRLAKAAGKDGLSPVGSALKRGLEQVGRLVTLAESRGLTLPQLSIGWLTSQADTVALTACTEPGYLQDALTGANVVLDGFALDKISDVRAELQKIVELDRSFNDWALELMQEEKLYYH